MRSKTNAVLLYLFAVSFALPDLAINVGIINLRLDDLVVYSLFLLNFYRISDIRINYKPRLFYGLHFFLISIASISLMLVVLLQHEFSSHHVVRFAGSLPMFLIMPILLTDHRNRTFLQKGSLIGITIFVALVIRNYLAADLSVVYQQEDYAKGVFKEMISFASLNSNSIGFFGILYGFILLQFYLATKKKAILIFAIAGILLPFITLARSHCVSVLVALSIYAIILRRSRKANLVRYFAPLVIISGILYFLSQSDNPIISSALDIDLSERGSSERTLLWSQGIELIKKSDGLGSGFATEGLLFDRYFNNDSGDRSAHNVYLIYAIELSVFSLIIFIISLIFLLQNRYKLFSKSKNELYLLQFSFLSGLMVSGFTDQFLYFNKYAFLIYALCTQYEISSPRVLRLQQ